MTATCDPVTAAGIAKFGFALFTLLAENQIDTPVVLVSPLSVSASLSLALAGATPEGAAERELIAALGVSSHASVAELSTSMLSGDEASRGVALRVANSVWVKQEVLPSFQQMVVQTHGARAETLSASYDELNAWVASKTEGRISKLMDPSAVDPLIVAVLVNAVYFVGSWTAAFNPQDTFQRQFRAPDGPLPARFMKRTGKYAASPGLSCLGGAAVVKLDYGKPSEKGEANDFCALMVLPATPAPESMAAAVRGLQSTPLEQLINELSVLNANVQIPRFKAEWGVEDLVAPLRTLGLSQAFDGDGQFLQLSSAPDVHIEHVFHKASLEVTEEGTVAAAASAVVMMQRSMANRALEISFDRPFLMLIVHTPTRVPLFIGRFNKPHLI